MANSSSCDNKPLAVLRRNAGYSRNAAAVKKVDVALADLDEGEIRMLNFFKLNDGKTFGKGEVVEKLGIYPRTAERELKHLVDLGLLIREGVGRSTVYRIAAQ